MAIKKSYEILKILLKDISKKHTVTSLSKERGISRVGSWKILKELEKENLIILTSIGPEKTSVQEVSLNWDNLILEKTLSLLLTEDALKQNKWRYNFKELENHVSFLILFGSILHSPKEANDIDILGLVSNEKSFVKISKIITDIQITQNKKIHAINLTEKELKHELKNKNKAYIEALKKGIILFGQENFIKFIKEISE
jgi:predicted nucleotidyltransferase